MTLPGDLNALLDDLRPAAARAVALERRRRRIQVAAAAAAAAALCTGVAFAADHFLGEPAPPAVQAEVRAMAAGFVDQPGLQAQTARVVATAPDATLYGVYDEHGSYCVEIAGASRGLIFGTTCDLGFGVASPNRMAGAISMPQANVIVDGVTPPVVVYGKLAPGAVSAAAILGDGSREPVSIGLGGFWVYEPSAAKQALARRLPIDVEERDASGRAVWTANFQPPLALATEGTPVRRVSGRLEIAGAAKLVVENIGGFHPRPQTVPLGPDGSFTWSAPRALPPRSIVMFSVRAGDGTELVEAGPLAEEVWRHYLEQARHGS